MIRKVSALLVVSLMVSVCVVACLPCSVTAVEDGLCAQSGETTRDVLFVDGQSSIAFESETIANIHGEYVPISSNTIVVVDGTSASIGSFFTRDVQPLVENGNPVLLTSGSVDLLSTESIGHSTAFMDSADIYGVIYDSCTGSTYCYSGIGYDDAAALNSAYEWVDECREITSSDNSTEHKPILFSLTKVQYSFGEMLINTKYTKTVVDDNTSLILTEYELSGDPYPEDSIWDNWISIADMRISCDHKNSELLDYGPSTSSDSRTTHNVRLSATQSGVTVTKNWDYSLMESRTSITKSGDSFAIWHDVDEKGSDKLSTKIMRPGTISLASKGDNIFTYQETDVYSVTFYKDSTIVSDKFATCEATILVTIL